MSLANQNWISLNGEPITGRIPPRLLVMNGVQPNPQQMGEVAHHYKLLTFMMKVAVVPYLVQERTLRDGTRIRMVSSYGVDTVMVWASDAQSEDSWDKGWSFIPANDNSLGGFLRRPGAAPDDLSAAAFMPLSNPLPAGNKVHTFVNAKTGKRHLCTDREGGARMWRGGKKMPVLSYDLDAVWVDGVKSVLSPETPENIEIRGAAIAVRDGEKWLVFVVGERLWAVRLSGLKAQTNDCIDCGSTTNANYAFRPLTPWEFSPDGMRAIAVGGYGGSAGYAPAELKGIYRIQLVPEDGTVPFRLEVSEQLHGEVIKKRVINTFHFNQAKRNFVFHDWKNFTLYTEGTYYGVIRSDIPEGPVEILIPRSDLLYDDENGPGGIVFIRYLRNGRLMSSHIFETFTNWYDSSQRAVVVREVKAYIPPSFPSFGALTSYCDARWGAVLNLAWGESISTQLNRHYGDVLNKRDYGSYLDFYEYLASRGNPLIESDTKYYLGGRQAKLFPEEERTISSFLLNGAVLANHDYTNNWTTDWVLESQVFLSGKAYIAAGYDAKGRERFLYMEGDDSQRLRYESSAKADDEPVVQLAWNFSGAAGYRLMLDDEVIDSCTYAVADGVTLPDKEEYESAENLAGPSPTIRAGEIAVHDFDIALGHVLYRKSEEVFTADGAQSVNRKTALRLSYRDFLKTSKDKHQLGEEKVFTSAQREVNFRVARFRNTKYMFEQTAPFFIPDHLTRLDTIVINGVHVNRFADRFGSLVPQAQQSEVGKLSGMVEDRWFNRWLAEMMLYMPGIDHQICPIPVKVFHWSGARSNTNNAVGRFDKPPQSNVALRAYSDDCWLVCYQHEIHIQNTDTDNTTARYFLKLAKDKPVKEFDAATYFPYLGASKKLLKPVFHIRKKT